MSNPFNPFHDQRMDSNEAAIKKKRRRSGTNTTKPKIDEAMRTYLNDPVPNPRHPWHEMDLALFTSLYKRKSLFHGIPKPKPRRKSIAAADEGIVLELRGLKLEETNNNINSRGYSSETDAFQARSRVSRRRRWFGYRQISREQPGDGNGDVKADNGGGGGGPGSGGKKKGKKSKNQKKSGKKQQKHK